MDELFAAQRQFDQCKLHESQLEMELVALLEQGDAAARLDAQIVEAKLEDVRGRITDAAAVVEYFRMRGDASSGRELVRLVLHSRQPQSAAPRTEDEWMPLIMRWSEANAKRGITGLLMTTGIVNFLVLEGANEDVQEVFRGVAADPDHADCTLLSIGKVTSREFVFGLKLHYIHDDLMATVLQRAQSDIIQSTAFAPQIARDVVAKGGDAEGIVPDHRPEAIAVAVLLDALCGASHTAATYMQATTIIENVTTPVGGVVVERFGEAMVIVFPYSHATQAITAAKSIVEAVPNAICSVATGSCTFVAAPYCWAFGSSLVEAKDLLYLAERERRPIMVSENAQHRCSKAHHRFSHITVDCNTFFTLQSMEGNRLGLEPDATEADIVIPQAGMVPVITPESNVTAFRHMSHQELVAKGQQEAVVRGALTSQKIAEYYRSLDPANAGWVSKDGVMKWMTSGKGPYQLFEPYEEKQLATWLSKHNALGSKLLNYDEFASLCRRMEAR